MAVAQSSHHEEEMELLLHLRPEISWHMKPPIVLSISLGFARILLVQVFAFTAPYSTKAPQSDISPPVPHYTPRAAIDFQTRHGMGIHAIGGNQIFDEAILHRKPSRFCSTRVCMSHRANNLGDTSGYHLSTCVYMDRARLL